MKKILILSGSGRRHGNSEKLANAFIKGAALHNEITKITLANKKIAPCCNCNYCQNHNGECAIHDDMQEIITALQNNEILVLCSPVYYLGLSAQLKTVIDRTYAESAIGRKIQSTILLFVSGKKDAYVSDCMINAYQQLSEYLGFQNLGIISAKGFEKPNEIEGSQILIDAFELGKSIV